MDTIDLRSTVSVNNRTLEHFNDSVKTLLASEELTDRHKVQRLIELAAILNIALQCTNDDLKMEIEKHEAKKFWKFWK